MIKRPMTGLAAVWLAGLLLAGLLPDVSPLFFICCYGILCLFFFVFSKKEPDWLISYVLPKRYPQLTLYLIFLPCFFCGGFFRMRNAALEMELHTKQWKEWEEKGEKTILLSGTVKEKRLEESIILVLENCVLEDAAKEEPKYLGSQKAGQTTVGNCQVYVAEEEKEWLPEVKIGNRILVYGTCSVYSAAGNPGQFDASAYYAGKNLYARIKAMRMEIQSEQISLVRQAMFELRQRLRESLLLLYPKEKAGVLAAMILGEKDLLPEEIKELYQQNGISHILAISGLHISMLCMGLFRGLRKISCPLFLSAFLSAIFLVFYIVFTGASTSSLRAGTMCLILLLGKLLRLEYDLLSALSFSAVLVTALYPMELFSAGFLLSFGALLGVAFASKAEEIRKTELERKRLWQQETVPEEKKTVWLEKIWGRLLPGTLLQCMTMPISLWFYYELSPYSIFLNVLILPLVSWILGGGILSMVLGLFSLPVGRLFGGGVYVLLEFYELLGIWTQKLPFSFVLLGKPKIGQFIFYYGLFLFWLCKLEYTDAANADFRKKKDGIQTRMERIWNSPSNLLFCCIFLGVCCLSLPKSNQAGVLFLDVSQGDSALIFTEKGKVLLSDCGSSDISEVGAYRLTPVLKERGSSIIDAAIVSHMDSDHISGIKEILEAMPVWNGTFSFYAGYDGAVAIRELILPSVQNPSDAYCALVQMAEQKNVKIRYAEAGETFYQEKDMVLECLWPVDAVESENDTSLVFLLQTETVAVWFMGDAGTDSEEQIIKNFQRDGLSKELLSQALEGKFVILKVGHHGSKTASGKEAGCSRNFLWISKQIWTSSCFRIGISFFTGK